MRGELAAIVEHDTSPLVREWAAYALKPEGEPPRKPTVKESMEPG